MATSADAVRAALLLALFAQPAAARTWEVGPDRALTAPSQGIAVAVPGDVVMVDPGEYFDCATWATPDVTLAGAGPGVVLSDKTCDGKAILVIQGANTVLRDLVLARARVPDGNGAAIRLEGQGLVAERVRFIDNQLALLGGRGIIRLSDCRVEGGGAGGEKPSFAVSVGQAERLTIERMVFEGVRGTLIGSAALETMLTGNQLATTRLAVSAAGRVLAMEDNTLVLSPGHEGRQAAVLANGDMQVTLRRNRLVNQTGAPATLLLDWTGGRPGAGGQFGARGGSGRRVRRAVAQPGGDGGAGGLGRAARGGGAT